MIRTRDQIAEQSSTTFGGLHVPKRQRLADSRAVGPFDAHIPTVNRPEALDVRAFGAVGDGVVDDGPAIQLAVNQAHANGGGVVFLPPAIYRYTSLSLDDRELVHVLGVADGGGHPMTQLRYAGTGSPAISMRSCVGITFENIHFFYSNPDFRDTLIEVGRSAAGGDPGHCGFENCWFSGVGTKARFLDLSALILAYIRGSQGIGRLLLEEMGRR